MKGHRQYLNPRLSLRQGRILTPKKGHREFIEIKPKIKRVA